MKQPSMTHLTLTLFGAFAVTANGEQVTAFATDKARGLLAYLALQPGQAHRRETLAALFWPEISHQSALTNLRQTFHRLRAGLDHAVPGSAERLFMVTRQSLQLNASAFSVDVTRFTALLAASEAHHHARLADCDTCLRDLAQAAALYRGELLAGFGLVDAAPFEEWLLLRREFYHQQALLVLQKLTTAYETRGDDEQAHSFAGRQLELDPYREDAHRQLMRLLARRGLTSQALAQFERCCRLLRVELGVDPDATTLALVAQIRAGQADDKATREYSRRVVTGGQGDKATREYSRRVVTEGQGDKVSSPTLQSPSHLVLLSPYPHNLPAQLTPLVGREAAVAELCARLQERTTRLVTIVGAGGMGKTRLALGVGQAIVQGVMRSAQCADGVYFVSLAPLVTPAAVAPTIATTLGLTLQGDPQQAVIQGLRHKDLLLILDNFEHLLDAATFVVTLLQEAPALQILVTSRERLQVRGEHLYLIPPLDYGQNVSPVTTGGDDVALASALSSVQLFTQSAQRIAADFALQPANVAAVLRICRLVQGMPLGLELAAAWIETLTPTAIADAITHSADILATAWRDAPARQRSMRAVFAWSWQLLGDEEQQALRQLAVFRGGFTPQAAQTVAGATLAVLNRLVQKSLLVCADQSTAAPRFLLHELLRQFAAEQLAFFPAMHAQVEQRHTHSYLAHLAARATRLARGEPRLACDEIALELDNVRQAWIYAATAGEIDALRPAAFSWWQFCILRGLEYEGRRTFALAVEGVRGWLATQPHNAAALQRSHALLSKLLAIHANYCFAQGQDEQMAALAREAIALGESSGSVEGQIFGHFVLGRALQEFGQIHDAAKAWKTAITLADAAQQDPGADELVREALWMAHIWLHGNRLALEKYEESRSLLSQALHFCQTQGKVRGQMECGSSLALSHFFQGNYMAAQQQYEEVLQLARALGSRRQEMVSQVWLGTVHAQQGDYMLAASLLPQGVALAAEIGAPYYEAMGLAALVRLYSYLGDQPGAQRWAAQLLTLLERSTLPKECQSEGLTALALKAHYAQEDQVALAYAEAAQQQLAPSTVASRKATVYLLLGHARAAMNQPTAADAYQQAIAACTKLGNVSLSSEAEAGLAQLALRAGEIWQAQRWVEAILPVLATQPRAGGTTPFFTYLTCYQVLAANQDERANTVLAQGGRLLQEYAAGISDLGLRRSFLEGVAAHWALMGLYGESS